MATIVVFDNAGNEVSRFKAEAEESIGTQAQDNGAPVPFSCGVGACRTCVGVVTQGMEHVEREAVSPQHITTEDDEVLTCIAGIKSDAPDDAEVHVQMENL